MRYSQPASENSVPGLETCLSNRDIITRRERVFLCCTSGYTSMVGWMGESKDSPDGYSGFSSPVQLTTNQSLETLGGDLLK